jgi:hypothetical protein
MADTSMSKQPRTARTGRYRAAAVALACALVPTVFAAVALADGPKTDGDPGLDFKGFMHLADLGYCTGQKPDCLPTAGSKHPAQLRMIGEDGAGHVLFYDVGYPHGIFSVDAEGHQASVLEEPTAVPADAGVPTTYAVDADHRRVFLGTATSQRAASDLCGAPYTVVCTTGPLAQTPVLASVQLADGESTTYHFPPAFDGQDVVALTPVTTASGFSTRCCISTPAVDPSQRTREWPATVSSWCRWTSQSWVRVTPATRSCGPTRSPSARVCPTGRPPCPATTSASTPPARRRISPAAAAPRSPSRPARCPPVP